MCAGLLAEQHYFMYPADSAPIVHRLDIWDPAPIHRGNTIPVLAGDLGLRDLSELLLASNVFSGQDAGQFDDVARGRAGIRLDIHWC